MKEFLKNGINIKQIGNYKIGTNSDKYVHRPIQNILTHDWLSPQPGFEVLFNGKKPYFQYQTRNQFTSW